MFHELFLPAASFVVALFAASAASAESESIKALKGEWILPDSADVLLIEEGGRWLHPKHGRAQMREANDDADLRIYYTSFRLNV
jgi:hypothetical protein